MYAKILQWYDRPSRVKTAVFFNFNKWTGDCKIYGAVQSLAIKKRIN